MQSSGRIEIEFLRNFLIGVSLMQAEPQNAHANRGAKRPPSSLCNVIGTHASSIGANTPVIEIVQPVLRKNANQSGAYFPGIWRLWHHFRQSHCVQFDTALTLSGQQRHGGRCAPLNVPDDVRHSGLNGVSDDYSRAQRKLGEKCYKTLRAHTPKYAHRRLLGDNETVPNWRRLRKVQLVDLCDCATLRGCKGQSVHRRMPGRLHL